MGFFSRLFSKSADDFLARGDELFSAQRFFEARSQYEDGLQAHLAKGGGRAGDPTAVLLNGKIARSNASLAEMNIGEAESCLARGSAAKAVEHLELALSLTEEPLIRHKAELMLSRLVADDGESGASRAATAVPAHGSCSSCASSAPLVQESAADNGIDMSPHDYYQLLIRQLPEEVYPRYAEMGDRFIEMYLAESRDEHERALALLEEWHQGAERDIYRYEKGMILHRLGRIAESEACLREAHRCNPSNPLPRLGLALLLIDGRRMQEAADILEIMIADGILEHQALMLRGEVALLNDDHAGAIERFGALLSTPFARPAAEKLHGLLLQSGRNQEAAVVFKKFLGGCRH